MSLNYVATMKQELGGTLFFDLSGPGLQSTFAPDQKISTTGSVDCSFFFHLKLGDEISGDDESAIFDNELFILDIDFAFDVGEFHAFLPKLVEGTATVTSTRHSDEVFDILCDIGRNGRLNHIEIDLWSAKDEVHLSSVV